MYLLGFGPASCALLWSSGVGHVECVVVGRLGLLGCVAWCWRIVRGAKWMLQGRWKRKREEELELKGYEELEHEKVNYSGLCSPDSFGAVLHSLAYAIHSIWSNAEHGFIGLELALLRLRERLILIVSYSCGTEDEHCPRQNVCLLCSATSMPSCSPSADFSPLQASADHFTSLRSSSCNCHMLASLQHAHEHHRHWHLLPHHEIHHHQHSTAHFHPLPSIHHHIPSTSTSTLNSFHTTINNYSSFNLLRPWRPRLAPLANAKVHHHLQHSTHRHPNAAHQEHQPVLGRILSSKTPTSALRSLTAAWISTATTPILTWPAPTSTTMVLSVSMSAHRISSRTSFKPPPQIHTPHHIPCSLFHRLPSISTTFYTATKTSILPMLKILLKLRTPTSITRKAPLLLGATFKA